MGVRTVELGVQSMDDGVLALAGRGHTAAHATAACDVLKGAGLVVGVQLMPGLPGETGGKALASLERVLRLRPAFIRIYPVLVIAGTGLETLYREGLYLPLALAEAVTLCKVMLHRALKEGVGVVRIGLQATVELESPGAILAGPYHPAFRQMVEAELCYDLLAWMVAGGFAASPVTIFCSPSRVSDVTGQKRGNLERLARDHGVRVAKVRGDPALSPMEIVIESIEGSRRGNMAEDLEYPQGVDIER
jgi:hypothetical protein